MMNVRTILTKIIINGKNFGINRLASRLDNVF